MYVSRVVRSIRDDPIEGESVALALTTDAIAITAAEATDEDIEFD